MDKTKSLMFDGVEKTLKMMDISGFIDMSKMLTFWIRALFYQSKYQHKFDCVTKCAQESKQTNK